MALVKGKKKGKRNGKIKISQRARIVEKNDATRVAKPDTAALPKMKARMPADVAPTFKIKIRKK